MLPEIDDELLAIFIGEALDHLSSIEASVLALEAAGEDRKAVDDVFRLFHTLKANAGALGLPHIEALAHRVEELLDRARDGDHEITGVEVELIFKAIDVLTQMVRDLERGAGADAGAGLGNDSAAIQAAVARLLDGGSTGEAPRAGLGRAGGRAAPSGASRPPERQPASGDVPTRATIKVDTGKLDSLVDLVGELVIAQSMVHQDTREVISGGERLTRSVAHLQRITSELHRGAIAMRLVTVRPTFQRMQRLVRDLSQRSGKPIDIVVSGEDTELDRKIVEEIVDPLTHMLRNSVDHGIEDPEARRRAGKPARARIALDASHEGGNVVISVSDDGRGLDTEALYARALATGLVPPDAKLTEAEIHALIFRPGFSTAREVTEMSGRGVGMDVVRRNVEALRGRVEIRSRAGLGTTLLIKLPLTLATIDGLLVRVNGQRFVVPTYSVQESLRPVAGQVHLIPGSGWFVDVRGQLVPLARLATLFGLEGAVEVPTEADLVVVEDDGRRVALMIDELIGKQTVVIKSLGDAFTDLPGVAGGAILADGRVGLILDAAGLIRLRERETPLRAA
jgi:two-component system chemotaxis sensor kinase CheA